MSPFLKRALPLLILLALLLPVGIYLAVKKVPPPAAPPASPPAEIDTAALPLSPLGEMPDWSVLGKFQETITRGDFERLLTTVFTTGGGWREFIEIDDAAALIRTGGGAVFVFRFAAPGSAPSAPRSWKAGSDLPPALRRNRLAGSTSPSIPATSAASGRRSRNAGWS